MMEAIKYQRRWALNECMRQNCFPRSCVRAEAA